jgi:hypothetical protein
VDVAATVAAAAPPTRATGTPAPPVVAAVATARPRKTGHQIAHGTAALALLGAFVCWSPRN